MAVHQAPFAGEVRSKTPGAAFVLADARNTTIGNTAERTFLRDAICEFAIVDSVLKLAITKIHLC